MAYDERSERSGLVEQCLLGAAMIDPKSAQQIVDGLGEDDFADPRHQAIWRAMRFLSPARSLDMVSVHAHLEDTDESAMVGGIAYLAGLDVHLPSLSSVPDLIRWVKERAVRRKMESAVREALGSDSSPEDVLRALRESTERLEGELPTTVTAAMLCDGAEEIVFPNDDERYLTSTGLIDLDAKIGGFEPGRVWTIAGRPSVGKSALGMHFGLAAAYDSKRVYLATLEMTRSEVVKRAVSSMSGVDHEHIRHRKYWHGEERRVRDTAHELDGLGFWVSDGENHTVQQIINGAAKHKTVYGLELLIVDYLQLLSPDGAFDRRDLAIADATRRLKVAARELDCCVVVLSQLNRQVEYRKSGRPMLADLRESGAVEQDSDGVILIWRPEGERPEVVELLVAKNRAGSTGPVQAYFRNRILRFENLAREDS